MTKSPGRRPLANLSDEMIRTAWMRADVPVARIAKALDVSPQAIACHARRMGLPRRNTMRKPKWDEALFRRMHAEGVSVDAMAEYFEYSSKATVTAVRKRLGIPQRKRLTRAERLTLAQFQELEQGRMMAAERSAA